MLCQRRNESHALPLRKRTRCRKRRPHEEMDVTVAKSFRAVLCAILRDELNIDTFPFEESKFHCSRRYEIRGRIVVRHHHSIHAQFSRPSAIWDFDIVEP